MKIRDCYIGLEVIDEIEDDLPGIVYQIADGVVSVSFPDHNYDYDKFACECWLEPCPEYMLMHKEPT